MARPRPFYVVSPEPRIDQAVRAEIDSLAEGRSARVTVYLSGPSDRRMVGGECQRTNRGRTAGRGSFRERISLWPRALRWRASDGLRTGSCIADNALAGGATSVHAHGGAGAFPVSVFASVLAGLRFTATVHSAGPLSRADIEALGMAESVFGISGHTVRALRERDVQAELVYPSAAASPSWRPGRALERDRSGVVVFVPEIPVDSSVLVDAAHRIGGDARFWAAGDADERLREEVASTGLSRRIAFFGPPIPGEASLLTATSDIVFLPEIPAASDLPFPVVMAMEAGLPVVGPKARGLREVLSGHMFDDPSGKAAADALAPLIADEGLRRRSGERNRRFAAENLGPGNVDKLRRAFMDPTGG